MFDTLRAQPQDKILALIQLYKEDPRPGKIDLGVGVYKDATGLTPVMRAVKAAERQLWEVETSKTYTTLAGDPAFGTAAAQMILGAGFPLERVASVATPGGTGAIRQALELIRLARPGATVWLSNPTWPNHASILAYLGMQTATYRYFDAATGGIDLAGALQDLGALKAGDVVLLHGCCHNPTGADPSAEDWAALAALLAARGAVPFVDLAYQGFGDGLEPDAAATRMLAARFPEMLIAASFSKNFGIYRERTGIVITLTEPARRDVLQGNLAFLNRQNYSFPPDHGARLVTMILADPALKAAWQAELEEVRLGILALRQGLADALRQATNSARFDFVAHHRGMFSRLGLAEAEVETLRRDHAIYMVSDSRVNLAGLNAQTVPRLATAIAVVAGGV